MSIRALLMAGIIAVAGGLAGAADAADKPVIAVLPKTVIGDVFMNNLANFAKAKGESLGATVEIYGASSHTAVEEQVSTMETLISRKVSANSTRRPADVMTA